MNTNSQQLIEIIFRLAEIEKSVLEREKTISANQKQSLGREPNFFERNAGEDQSSLRLSVLIDILCCLGEHEKFDSLVLSQLGLFIFSQPTAALACDFATVANRPAHKIRNALIVFDVDYPQSKTKREENYLKYKNLLFPKNKRKKQ